MCIRDRCKPVFISSLRKALQDEAKELKRALKSKTDSFSSDQHSVNDEKTEKKSKSSSSSSFSFFFIIIYFLSPRLVYAFAWWQ